MSEEGPAAVKVAVRVRPLTPKECMDNTNECIAYPPKSATSKTSTLLIDTNRAFEYDYIFPPSSTQEEVFAIVEPMVVRFVDGYNVTTIAYGQTGSGKTHTMGTGLSAEENDKSTGIICRAIFLLFDMLAKKQAENPGFKYSLAVSFLELYNEELIDLLNPLTRTANRKGSALTIREDASGNVIWAGVKEELVAEPQDLIGCLRKGSVCRTTGSTDMNLTSSRSHAIYTVILRQEVPDGDSSPSKENQDEQVGGAGLKKMVSKFHFVDLAGSERMKKTKAVGDRAKEGIAINSGLLAMGKVIHALNDGANHVPYRDSKLTRLLQDALGGNSQTLMIACVSSADSNFGETLNTLNYASRARNIKNKVVQNQDFQAMEVHQLRAEISRLKMELMTSRSQNYMPKTTAIANSLGSGELVSKKENEAIIGEIRRLEMIVYQLQQKNTELRGELTAARSERDSLLYVQQKGTSDGSNSTTTNSNEIHPMIAGYQSQIAELQAKLDDYQQIVGNPVSLMNSTLSLARAESKFMSNQSLANISRSISVNMSTTGLASPLHKQINATIEKAKEEIEKEKQLLEKTARATTPSRPSRPSADEEEDVFEDAYENTEDDIQINTNAEDDMIKLLDQISTDIRVKEELVSQLQTTQTEYSSMKEVYEGKLRQMHDQISSILKERDQAMKLVESSSDKDKDFKRDAIKNRYEDKLKKITEEMNQMKRKHDSLQKELFQKKQTNETLINSMKVHLENLRKEKMKLMKKMKEKDVQIRDKDAEKDREMNRLKRKERQLADKAKKLEQNNRMQQIMLKQRSDETVQAQGKLKSVMALLKKTKNIASPISRRKKLTSGSEDTPVRTRRSSSGSLKDGSGSGILKRSASMEVREQERLKVQAQFKKNLLYNELNQVISVQHVNEVLNELTEKLHSLEDEQDMIYDELAQLNSRLDMEYQRAKQFGSPLETDEGVQRVKQQIQDTENRLDILEAEIQYYTSRIKSTKLEAKIGSKNSMDSIAAGEETQVQSYDNAVDMVRGLGEPESKKLLELMLDDLITLKLQDRNRMLEMESLLREKDELKKTVEVMRRAANSMAHGRLSIAGQVKVEAAGILNDMANLHDEMREIEKALGDSGSSSGNNSQRLTLPRQRSMSYDQVHISVPDMLSKQRPPFIPTGSKTNLNAGTSLGSMAALSLLPTSVAGRSQTPANINNIFERLHREQTVASQLKISSKPPSRGNNEESPTNTNAQPLSTSTTTP